MQVKIQFQGVFKHNNFLRMIGAFRDPNSANWFHFPVAH